MSIRFLNPHNVTHGETSIAKCREASVSNRLSDVRRLAGDAERYPATTVGFQPASEISIVTEDVAQALSIAPGTQATLSFDVRTSALDLTVRRGDYWGVLYVSVDGGPANGLPRDDAHKLSASTWTAVERRSGLNVKRQFADFVQK